MAQTVIYTTSNSTQDGIIITDQTDWTQLGQTISVLSGISISLYDDTLSLVTTYSLSNTEETEYNANGTVEIPFINIVNNTFLEDAWWTIQMSSNSGAYISNYSSFGIYADITYIVFSQINNLHVPEDIKFNAEKYCIPAIFLKGLGYLDTTNIVSREVKFNKRLIALQKMTANI